MFCKNPYINPAGKAYGCGQCFSCKLNKRRLWTHRLILEQQTHASNIFLTLTYSDIHLPIMANGSSTLSPRDLELFLKKLRKRMAPLRFRFFGVGEYGNRTSRPHYHLLLFNFPSCANGQTILTSKQCCPTCETVLNTWSKGAAMVGTVTPESIQYTARYTVKKMTNTDDIRLSGRHPEFSRQSRKPGIGHSAIQKISDSYKTIGPLPSALRHGSKILPLGPYLTKKAKEAGVEFKPHEMHPLPKAAGYIEIPADFEHQERFKKTHPGQTLRPYTKMGNEKVMRQFLQEQGDSHEKSLINKFKTKEEKF